jgi:uncharacterized protein YkwD
MGTPQTPTCRITWLLAALASAAVLTSPVAASAASCPNADAPPILTATGDYQAAMLCLLNDERTSRGLTELRSNQKLLQTATGHSESMRQLGYFSHTDPDGTTLANRIEATGYLKGARRWRIGENLAWGGSLLGTPRALLGSWMTSAAHRANVLESQFREIGLGIARGNPGDPLAPGAVIITADFGLASRFVPGKSGKKRKRHRQVRTTRGT